MRDEVADANAALVRWSVGQLNADELAVVAAVVRRLRRGRETYGPLDVAGDSRCWRRERVEELEDALVYSLIDEVARGRRELVPPVPKPPRPDHAERKR